ncbi:hypothetical protein MUK42_31463, partial [Musa troglodytarum]
GLASVCGSQIARLDRSRRRREGSGGRRGVRSWTRWTGARKRRRRSEAAAGLLGILAALQLHSLLVFSTFAASVKQDYPLRSESLPVSYPFRRGKECIRVGAILLAGAWLERIQWIPKPPSTNHSLTPHISVLC